MGRGWEKGFETRVGKGVLSRPEYMKLTMGGGYLRTIYSSRKGCILDGFWFYTWVFPKIGVPQNGWFIMENPIKMDDLGVPLFLEPPHKSSPPKPTRSSWVCPGCAPWKFRIKIQFFQLSASVPTVNAGCWINLMVVSLDDEPKPLHRKWYGNGWKSPFPSCHKLVV